MANHTKTIYDTVRATVIEGLMLADPITITPQSSFVANLGCDSVDAIDLTMRLEDAFEVHATDEELTRVVTLRDAVVLVDKCLRAQGRTMPLGIDPAAGASAKPDWHVRDAEPGGEDFVVYDVSEPDEDATACQIVVKGRGAEQMAKRLAELLNTAGA
ncbi:MAG TPA: acyl carrier protein [Albitalea sp.]|nr:acyl carrier protein [Albitalea sp.]